MVELEILIRDVWGTTGVDDSVTLTFNGARAEFVLTLRTGSELRAFSGKRLAELVDDAWHFILRLRMEQQRRIAT